MDLPALGEENLAKKFGGKRQKLNVEPSSNRRERERERKFKTFEKGVWKSQDLIFLKTWFTIFDWSKINFDWSKLTEAHINFQLQFRLIEEQVRSIKIVKKNEFLKNNWFWCRLSSKHWILCIKCMSMRWNAFQKPKIQN